MFFVDDGSRPKPTAAELSILRVLWERGPSTVRETHESLAQSRDLGYTTVLKTMQIMVEKHLLERTEKGRAHLYRPTESEAKAKRSLVGDFMDRAFGGSARELVMHALEAKPASSEELAEIRRMLDELEERNG